VFLVSDVTNITTVRTTAIIILGNQHVKSPYDSDKRKHLYASLRSAVMVDIDVAKHEMHIQTSDK
jgi:hypothetical protein